MPQLDKLTFFNQAFSLIFIFIFLFVFIVVFMLPRIYKVKKIRWFLQRQNENLVLPSFLLDVYELQIGAINSSCALLGSSIQEFVIEAANLIDTSLAVTLDFNSEEELLAEAMFDFYSACNLFADSGEIFTPLPATFTTYVEAFYDE